MRALCYRDYGGIDALQLKELPQPQIGGTDVLIRVQAASLNPFDWKLRNGILRTHFEPDFPITPGRDGYGEIVALGDEVESSSGNTLRRGQRVCFISSRVFAGSCAEYAAVSAADFVVPAPGNLQPEEAAALPMTGLSAWNAVVDTAELKKGMRILVHGGAGGVGRAAIQIARHLGAEVFVTCRSAKQKDVQTLGATAIPYDEVDFTSAVADCDVVIDTVGGSVHEASHKVIKPGGRLVYLIAAPFKDLSANYDVSVQQAVIHNRTANLREVARLASVGVIVPAIGAEFALDDFEEAFNCAEDGAVSGKVVLMC